MLAKDDHVKKWKGRMARAAAIIAALFGALTIRSGGAVLFGANEAAQAAGAVVPFVVWFNFIAGFAYLVAAIGLWRVRRWGAWAASGIAGASAVVFVVFAFHAATGAAFEMRTVWAMTLRTALWTGIAMLAFFATGAVSAKESHA